MSTFLEILESADEEDPKVVLEALRSLFDLVVCIGYKALGDSIHERDIVTVSSQMQQSQFYNVALYENDDQDDDARAESREEKKDEKSENEEGGKFF